MGILHVDHADEEDAPKGTGQLNVADVLMHIFCYLEVDLKKVLLNVGAVSRQWRFYSRYLPHWNALKNNCKTRKEYFKFLLRNHRRIAIVTTELAVEREPGMCCCLSSRVSKRHTYEVCACYFCYSAHPCVAHENSTVLCLCGALSLFLYVAACPIAHLLVAHMWTESLHTELFLTKHYSCCGYCWWFWPALVLTPCLMCWKLRVFGTEATFCIDPLPGAVYKYYVGIADGIME